MIIATAIEPFFSIEFLPHTLCCRKGGKRRSFFFLFQFFFFNFEGNCCELDLFRFHYNSLHICAPLVGNRQVRGRVRSSLFGSSFAPLATRGPLISLTFTSSTHIPATSPKHKNRQWIGSTRSAERGIDWLWWPTDLSRQLPAKKINEIVATRSLRRQAARDEE